MTNCTNCFSGCVETVSDKCVKYTGNSIEFLGITTGDTLESVEKALTDYLLTVLNGEGIIPTIEYTDLCDIIKVNLPCVECGDYTLVEILTALIKTICTLEEEIIVEREKIDIIEADYTPSCISVAADAGTHDVLQAVITKVCSMVSDITALQNLYTTCITTGTINTYIAAYINGISVNTKMYSKMVPYVAYPYYGTDLTAFGVSGVGTVGSVWEKVYLCNGYNGLTPDLRGRILIGVTTGMGGGALDPIVDPVSAGNPNYTLSMTAGANSVTLSANQIPSHTHSITTVDNHTHVLNVHGDNINPGQVKISGGPAVNFITGSEVTEPSGAHSHTIGSVGGGLSHSNIPPVKACVYIMHIP